MSLIDRLKNAVNAFNRRDPVDAEFRQRPIGMVSSNRPDRARLNYGNERSIIASIYNRISVDCAQIKMEVVKTDDEGRYLETIKDSGLNTCLNVEANKDQTGRAFRQDAFMSIIDEGCIAIVPVDTDIDPTDTESYEILSLRVGKITEWYPDYVRVQLYDDRTGKKRDVRIRKDKVGIIENPFYSIMNENNSTLKRLTMKLNLLDVVDEQTSSGKLDIIIQLPYVIKSEARRAQAEKRRKDIEEQLAGSKYGIAYTDGTEHITQLNRPAENNLLAQVEYLQNLLFSQLGMTQAILDGTADEQTMNNYYERTIEPLVAAVTDELTRKFFAANAKTRGKKIMCFNDPFRFVPTSKIPDLADKLIRNEILTSNEFRANLGYKPADKEHDELNNPNLNKEKEPVSATPTEPDEEIQNGGKLNG